MKLGISDTLKYMNVVISNTLVSVSDTSVSVSDTSVSVSCILVAFKSKFLILLL